MSGIGDIEVPSLGLKSRKSLLNILDISEHQLSRLTDAIDKSYGSFELQKPDGTARRIDYPRAELKRIQRNLHSRLLLRAVDSPIVYGGVRKRSHFDAAALHTKAASVANIDLTAFYPHVASSSVYSSLIDHGCAPDIARIVTRLITLNGHLPQGSPASTTAANLVLSEFDRTIGKMAAERGLVVTRFIDDITISGSADEVQEMVSVAIHELHRLGFRVNRRKTGIASRGQRQRVLGLSVNRQQIRVPKDYRKLVRDSVRQASRYGITEKKRQSLLGKIRHIERTNPGVASKLRRDLARAPVSCD